MRPTTDDQRPTKLLSTFGRRRGRKLRAGKQELVDTLLPRLRVTLPEAGMLAPAQMFGAEFSAYWLEIGFGGGEHLAEQAARNPRVGFIGCEPYVNGFGNLLKLLEGRDARNVRLFTDDARLLMARLPDACLHRVFILFPDPWPKARHHKRRLIQEPFLAALARVMAPGAELLLATDHADYCTWMLERMPLCPDFAWTAKTQADWATPPADWVRTGYQIWAEQEGRAATYLRFIRN